VQRFVGMLKAIGSLIRNKIHRLHFTCSVKRRNYF
jgi:hypothetical protein